MFHGVSSTAHNPTAKRSNIGMVAQKLRGFFAGDVVAAGVNFAHCQAKTAQLSTDKV